MTTGPIVAVLLAGGQARRMGGGDKCLKMLGGRTLLARVVERIAPQVDAMVLNANGDPERFSDTGLPVVPDDVPGFAGPLAGILAGLDWSASHMPRANHIVSIATDTPFFPLDLVKRLQAVATKSERPLACAASRDRTHPVFGLWSVDLRDDLRRALTEENMRKVDVWTARHGIAVAGFPDTEGGDPFFNINSTKDIREAEDRRAQSEDGDVGTGGAVA